MRDGEGSGYAAVINGAIAATSLLTWIADSKYLDHLPPYDRANCRVPGRAGVGQVARLVAGDPARGRRRHWHSQAIDIAMKRYAGWGRLPIDNNSVENAIRPIANGETHWLFTV